METHQNFFHRPIGIAGLFLIIFIAFSCGNRQSKTDQKEFKKIQETQKEAFTDFLADIDKRIDFIDELIEEESSSELQENLKELQAELEDQKKIISAEIDNLMASSIEQWPTVRDNARAQYLEVREKYNETAKKINKWLED